MTKKCRKLLIALLTVIMTAMLAVTGAIAFAPDGDTTTVPEKPAASDAYFNVTKITTFTPSELDGVFLELETDLPEIANVWANGALGGHSDNIYVNKVTIKSGRLDKVLENGTKDGKVKQCDVNLVNGNKIQFKYTTNYRVTTPADTETGTAAVTELVRTYEFKEGDLITVPRGYKVQGPKVVTGHDDTTGKDITETAPILGYFSDTITYKFTEGKWINQTEVQRAAEPKLRAELQNEAKGTAVAGGGFGAEFIKFYDKSNNTLINPDYNDSNWGSHLEIAEYIEFKGADGTTKLPGWFRYASAVRLGNDGGHTFVVGDKIIFHAGLHFNQAGGGWPGTNNFAELTYNGYLDETVTYFCTGSGWIVESNEATAMAVEKINAVTKVAADAVTPAHYSFAIRFNHMVAWDETSNLEANAIAEKIIINNKTVKEWNEELKDLVDEDSGEPIVAVQVSAYTTDITIKIMECANIWNETDVLTVKVASGLTAPSNCYTETDLTRYYLAGSIKYWSDVEPYTVEKTNPVNIKNLQDIRVEDNGANRWLLIEFDENLVNAPILWYNCLPDYRLTLPANPFNPSQTGQVVSADAYNSFLENVIINGTSIAQLYAGDGSPESKSSIHQCHIGADGGNNVLRISTAVATWTGNDPITVTFKKGLVFASGVYVANDIDIVYTPANGETTPATTLYSVKLGEATVSTDVKYNMTKDDTATFTVTGGEATYQVEDEMGKVEDGVFTPLKAGKACVNVTVGENTAKFWFKTAAAEATGVEFDTETVKIAEGNTVQLNAAILPKGFATGTLTYSSDNTEVATVDETGLVTGVKEGTAVITVTLGAFTDTVTVTVSNAIPATELTVDKTSLELKVEGTAKITATATPADTTDAIEFISGDTTIVTVDKDGNVTALKVGTTTITVTCGTLNKTVNVTVKPATVPATGLTVDKTKVEMKEGESVKVTATATPNDTTDTITFEVKDATIATVDQNGNIKGVKKGTTTVTVKCGDKTATIEVKVNAKKSGGCNAATLGGATAVLVTAVGAAFVLGKRK